MSAYQRYRAAGRCGQCNRKPRPGRKSCDVCIAKAVQRVKTGSIVGWERVLWRQCIKRLMPNIAITPRARGVDRKSSPPIRLVPPPQPPPPQRIRTDDPHFGTIDWILSLRFDLARIDKQRPPYWLLKQIYWQTRKRVLHSSWRHERPIWDAVANERDKALRRVSAAYEARLIELGLAQPAVTENIEHEIRSAA